MTVAARRARGRAKPPHYTCRGGPLDGMYVGMDWQGKDEYGNAKPPLLRFVYDRVENSAYVLGRDGMYHYEEAGT